MHGQESMTYVSGIKSITYQDSLTPVADAPDSECRLPVGDTGGSGTGAETWPSPASFFEASSDIELLFLEAVWLVCCWPCSPTVVDDSDLSLFFSCSLEVSAESFGVLLWSVSLATLEVIPPDVVKATVGETVTAVTVVSVVSVLLGDVLLIEHELDCVVQVVVEVESWLVTGSNCTIKQVRLTIDACLGEHHGVKAHTYELLKAQVYPLQGASKFPSASITR